MSATLQHSVSSSVFATVQRANGSNKHVARRFAAFRLHGPAGAAFKGELGDRLEPESRGQGRASTVGTRLDRARATPRRQERLDRRFLPDIHGRAEWRTLADGRRQVCRHPALPLGTTPVLQQPRAIVSAHR